MQTQLRVLQTDQAKGKSAGKAGTATEQLQYLINFSTSITQCVAKAMGHLSDSTFVSMANLTLQKGLILGTCEVQAETGHTGSLMSSSSGLVYTVSRLCVEKGWR